MSKNTGDWGEEYQEEITVDGESYVEVGYRDPGNEGYHTIRVPYDEDAGRGSVEDEVASAKEKLRSHIEQIED